MVNQLLKEYLDKRKNEPTVILCFRILLDNALRNGLSARMTKSEIEKIFNSEHKKFGIQTFRRDYVMRQSGNTDNAIDQDDKMFFIRPEYFENVTFDDLRQVSLDINEHYYSKFKEREKILLRISNTLKQDNKTKYDLIYRFLCEEETDRRGQNFEITSFAILKVFYHIRGFDLNRFSTIYSNDGGVDFAGQNAIYQVTTKLNDKKLLEDLDKAPLKRRIFVFREAVKNFDYSLLDNELIVDTISISELVSHLDYLNTKNPDRHLTQIINVILEEFNREYYLS